MQLQPLSSINISVSFHNMMEQETTSLTWHLLTHLTWSQFITETV